MPCLAMHAAAILDRAWTVRTVKIRSGTVRSGSQRGNAVESRNRPDLRGFPAETAWTLGVAAGGFEPPTCGL